MEAARIEKEKEIARLRAQQERAKDKQAEKVNFALLILKKTAAKTAQKKIRQQQQQQCIYLKKYKVYNTLCPANSYNANLGRTRL